MKKTAYNVLTASLLLAATFLFSCTGDDEVMLDRIIPLSSEVSYSSSVRVSSSSSSPSSVDSSSSEAESGEDSSSSNEENGEDSSSSDAGSSDVSSSSSDELSSSSTVSSSSSSEPSSSSGIPKGSFVYDGQTYSTVRIGEQTWMAENLNFSASSGSVCYGDLESNCAKYGKLYTWEAAKTSCPAGWHLPSVAEWDKLSRYIDGNTGTSKPYSSTTAGGKLKAKSGWSSGNGTDDFGFEALPGGDRLPNGNFSNLEKYGKWWSSEADAVSNNPYRRTITHTIEAGWEFSNNLIFSYSVRCIQGD